MSDAFIYIVIMLFAVAGLLFGLIFVILYHVMDALKGISKAWSLQQVVNESMIGIFEKITKGMKKK